MSRWKWIKTCKIYGDEVRVKSRFSDSCRKLRALALLLMPTLNPSCSIGITYSPMWVWSRNLVWPSFRRQKCFCRSGSVRSEKNRLPETSGTNKKRKSLRSRRSDWKNSGRKNWESVKIGCYRKFRIYVERKYIFPHRLSLAWTLYGTRTFLKIEEN